MDNIMQGVIGQSVSVLGGFVNRLGSGLVMLFRDGWEKSYSNNLVECAVFLTHVCEAGAASVSWRSDSESEAESGPSSWKW